MLNVLPPTLDIAQYQQLKQETLRTPGFFLLPWRVDDQAALEALYEQFRCLASVEFKNDPMKLGAAIDRAAYSECVAFLEVGSNVIFDKMFEIYDTDKNGLIGFKNL